MAAGNVQLHEDRGGTPSLTMAEIFEDYATDLLREFGHDPDRALAAARAVAAKAVGKVGYPMLWRHVALAVEMTGQVLPGSYRPGSRASSDMRREAPGRHHAADGADDDLALAGRLGRPDARRRCPDHP